jgi:hypothetical protein
VMLADHSEPFAYACRDWSSVLRWRADHFMIEQTRTDDKTNWG